MDHRGIEVRVECLALVEQGNDEEHARWLQLMVYDGHMKL
jgi:hypothetical protein